MNSMDCYVYYRVSTTHADAARQAVARLFALTATQFGVSGRLQSRADASPNDAAQHVSTWMERYDNVDAAFIAALPQMVMACGLAAYLEGERHVECFVDMPTPPPPCA
ncbi:MULTISPECIES: DUF4936 family protein [Pandoraea]|uniref:DUF4936 family protein n=1 Tax=Pandoraea TaxID=93217 RepID=UPI001F5DB980|nr:MULTISPECIES: DUF4936 family protein [Pandoraea]MCI3208381.1 hypothetical protein [Pandoraea sp. LA3]MDN4586410.1 hypothetical protein [Pandoraea capi]